jgi:hypothetical protein
MSKKNIKRIYFIVESETETEKQIIEKVNNLSVIYVSSFKFKTQIWVRRSRDLLSLNKLFPKSNYSTTVKFITA